MPKPFLTYPQQIQKLKDKNLTITDDAATAITLHHYGYFALISGYKDLFKNPTTKDYRDGTTLDDIVALYRFDEQLRELTLRYLLQVERHIRSAYSYAFCSQFGESQNSYLDANNYNLMGRINPREVQKLITRHLQPFLSHTTDYPYIEHHKQVHGNVPLWVLINALTFGTLSKMYALSQSKIQAVISKEFVGVREKQLGSMLEVLTKFRNVCAHNERLFSYNTKNDISDLPLHKKMQIPQNGQQYIYGKHDYFALVLSFRYLLPNKDFLTYKAQLAKLIDKADRENRQLAGTDLLWLMGFPENWKKITAYKKV